MLFTHDTDLALTAAAALVNTDSAGVDSLGDIASLDGFVAEWGWTGTRRHDRAELDAVRALRPRLRRLWDEDDDGVARIVNDLLRKARALPQLVSHDSWGYHLHATPPQAPLADRIAVDAAMAFADLVRTEQLDRLRSCAAPDCDDVVVDLSKNRSRRFCAGGCGNRVNVAAYRARRAGTA